MAGIAVWQRIGTAWQDFAARPLPVKQTRLQVPEAERDAVTGLPGLDAARQRLAQWCSPEAGEAPSVHALLLGIRRFETINLAYGTATGDAVLAELAVRITHFAADELDGPWFVARGGGGSFLVVAREACSRERWQLFAEQLADVAARPMARANGGTLRLSPRIALLRAVADESAESVLDRLAQTLEIAQRRQGRRVCWADGEVTRAGRTAAELEADLHHAIERGEIEVLYQPQFALDDGRLTGAEALARWNHPLLGRIGAGALFAIAERADQVTALSRQIARLALAGAAQWPEGLRLSLNVTPADLGEPGFAEALCEAVAASGFDPARLTIEVTEQVLLADIQLAGQVLGELAARGMRVALDDFGAGFCNFRYLKLLPLHYLKLDRSMADGISEDGRDLAVLRAIVAMAGALGLAVIAEGIETEEQRALIAAEGCAYYQGFLGAQPMAADEFAALSVG